MKVVINKCYGGFNLSDEAIEMCIELGMTAKDEKSKEDADFIKFKVKSTLSSTKYYSTTLNDNSFRCNPIVIKVVEELGKKASGFYSKLRIPTLTNYLRVDMSKLIQIYTKNICSQEKIYFG